MSGTTSCRTRPTATWSARRSPRDGSPRSTCAAPRPRPACSPSSPRRMPASSARADCNTAKLLGGPEIEHYHQAIALVVAETFEQARAAAQLVRVDYVRAQGRVRPRGGQGHGAKPPSKRHRRPAGYRGRRLRRRLRRGAGPARRDLHDARPGHAMMEPHAIDRGLGRRQAHALDLEPDDRLGHGRPRQDARHPQGEGPRSISPFIGGGFGGKLFLRADALLAALGARAAGRPVKVALHAAADAQQHHASAGDDPAHPHRRDAGRQDHRDRARELVRRPARRQARDGGAADAAALCRRQPPDRDAACGARPARRQRDARARRGAGHDGARDRHGRDGREARASIPSSSASSTTPRSIPRSRSGRSRSATSSNACASAPSASAGASATRSPAQTRDGRWLVGMGVAAALPQQPADEVGGARAARQPRHRHGRDRHDRHRHRQLHHHRPDRGRDDGRAARQGRRAARRLDLPGLGRLGRAVGRATTRPPASMPPA